MVGVVLPRWQVQQVTCCLAVLETGVDVTHPEDHVAGGHLLLLLVGCLVALHVVGEGVTVEPLPLASGGWA